MKSYSPNPHKIYLSRSEFKEQNRFSGEIEDSVQILTHEIGTQMWFEIDRLKKLLKYFDFRKTYKEYSDEELSKILDEYSELNIVKRKEILKKGSVKELIFDWNKAFNNKSYKNTKEGLRLSRKSLS